MLEIEPAGGTAQPICVDLQHFFYVVAGGVDVTIGSDPPVELAVGAFVYVPPGVSFTMSCRPTAPARIIAVKKRYEKAEGIATPTAIIGQQQSMPMTNHTGLQGRGFKHLLPMGDLRFDFEMNLMFFQPGVCFPAVETHIMEHGLFMLEAGGVEVRAHLRRLVRHIRTRWHNTQITFRGDGHYARPEAMAWCETNGIDYIFGLSGTKPLARKVDEVADDIRTRRAIENLPVLRGYTETRHKAKSWDRERRTVARIEATMLGLDIRFVVTSLDVGSAEWIYDSLYCARGQAENLIKLHKTQLASDRTSCRSALANQVRLVLHTAAYWLMLTVREAIPKVRELAAAEFATLRLRLLKLAARVVETSSRIRLAFAAACPEADLIRCLPGALLPLGP
ncbi:IS1380 family transposase [Bradyrhizobium diazoefficiens]